MGEERPAGGGIERLKKKLYSRAGEGLGAFKRRRLPEDTREVPYQWSMPHTSTPKKKRNTHALLSGLFLFSVLFFVASVAVAAFFFFGGATTVSSRNIDIEIQGPATIGGGEELALQVAVTNRNATSVQAADLLVEYPEGTRAAGDLSKELPRYRESLGTIASGERVERTVRAVLFGEEGSDVSVVVVLEYRVEGSNAIFFKEQTYDLVLATAPLAITVEAVDEITSGQDTEFQITVASNSEEVIKDVLLVAEYPFGFEFIESAPRPVFTNNVWALGDIEPEGKRTIVVRGTVVGENEQERVFRFLSGIRSEVDETQLETAFVSALHTMVIEKPFIGVELALDGSTRQEYAVQGGKQVRADIRWFNNLPTRVFDAQIDVVLSGDVLSKRSVRADSGFYSSLDNTISWTRETEGALAELPEGDSGSVSFSFAPKGLAEAGTLRNPEIVLEVNIQGTRLSEREVPESITSSVVRRVKVVSDVLLSSRAVYFTGPFDNTGPMPPQVEKETTYTVLWTVTNSHNNVSDTTVEATLPSYVRFVGAVEPSSADISFNEIGGKVLWSVGDMVPGGKREVAFQAAIIPSLSQVNNTPVLVNEQVVRSTDRFAGVEIRSSQPPLTTRLLTDPHFESEHGQVVE